MPKLRRGMKPHEDLKNLLATDSLNLLRLCVKYNLGRRLVLPHVPKIILDDHDRAIAGTASASDKKLRRGPPSRKLGTLSI